MSLFLKADCFVSIGSISLRPFHLGDLWTTSCETPSLSVAVACMLFTNCVFRIISHDHGVVINANRVCRPSLGLIVLSVDHK